MKRLLGTRRSASAFISIAVAFMINMMGTTLPTPIYRFYQQQYGFTPTLITVIYACYAVGVLGALLTVGNWSDQLGRRRMLFVGLCASAASAIAFITSHGATGLMVGRLLSGLSAGIFTSTATVAVIELAPPAWQPQATLAATASNMLGLGFGPLLSGILVALLPRPTIVPYAVHLALVSLALIAVWRAPETARPAERTKLQFQRISLPMEVRDAFIPAALAGFAGFVVVGFFAAVVPQLISVLLGYHSSVLIGALVFLLFACSAIGQTIQARIATQHRLTAGCIGLAVGLTAIALCVLDRSLTTLVVGTTIAGIGQGVSFRASLGDLAAKCPSNRRAEVTSSFFVVLYIAISLPVIGLGFAVQRIGIAHATLLFAILTTLTVLIALWLIVRRQRQPIESAAGR
ncbi:MFS transporter [Paraburkholderia sp. J10-1]|uniref:MFS transporter n=1 Tax=Paraburkholderia sp. J10-1 TaxID=2805430 RepID=UPI002AB62E76|nr:MFS transporter [Paraburkholderia sp. J10-1]